MRIAFLTTLGGGVDPYVRTATPFLLDRGHTVHVLYFSKNRPAWPLNHANLHIHTVPRIGNWHYYLACIGMRRRVTLRVRQYEGSLAAAREIRRIYDRFGLDLVEVMEAVAFPNLFKETPFIYKMHGSDWSFNHYCEDGPVFKSQIRNQRKMILAAAQSHALSRSLADFMAGACDLPRRLIRVTPYPIDLREFSIAGPPTQDRPFTLMAVGRLERRKGTHTLVQALREVWKYEPQAHLRLFGSDGDFGRQFIEAEVPPSEHQGRIHFEGFVERRQLVRAYQQAHIYVSPTRYETFGYTILEAMACGRPVISTDIGPIPELVRHEETGWLVPRDDVSALAETILFALHHPDLRESYGRAGRNLAERYDIDMVMERQLKLYEEAL